MGFVQGVGFRVFSFASCSSCIPELEGSGFRVLRLYPAPKLPKGYSPS